MEKNLRSRKITGKEQCFNFFVSAIFYFVTPVFQHGASLVNNDNDFYKYMQQFQVARIQLKPFKVYYQVWQWWR